MPDKPNRLLSKPTGTKSGIMPLPILEPQDRREPPMPEIMPEDLDDRSGSTTGIMPVVTEGEDISAEREDDPAN